MEALFTGQNVMEFIERFDTDEKCMSYLADIKWKNGFECPKCKHTKAWKGFKPYTKVCAKCRKIESATSNTLFHKVKFGLRKAFMIAFEVATSNKSMSANYIATRYHIDYNTAWYFMKKVRLSMKSTESKPMKGTVYVDEYVIGGHEEGGQGRKRNTKKKKVVVAVEVTGKGKIKRCYHQIIENYSTKEIRKIFDAHIDTTATVRTDEFNSYKPLKSTWTIIQDKSIRKQNTSPCNRIIQQLKSWLRGVHHHTSKKHLQGYLDEYSFRINRSQWKESIFNKCIERMLTGEVVTRASVFAN